MAILFVAAAKDQATNAASIAEENLGQLEIEPALLSLVCRRLNELRKAQRKPRFDDALLSGGTGQSIIADYYRDTVSDFPEPVQRFIEEQLITERGFRKQCDVDDAKLVHGITKGQLDLLVDRRVIRIEPWRGTERIELIHDLLTKVVREGRDQKRAKENDRRWLIRIAVTGAIVIVPLFTALYLKAQTAWKAQMTVRVLEAQNLVLERINPEQKKQACSGEKMRLAELTPPANCQERAKGKRARTMYL